MHIHPSSIVSSRAKIGNDVVIGPFCIVEDDVEIGSGCHLDARVTVKSGSEIGENNRFCDGSVIGGFPQHAAVHDNYGRLIIGNGNVFRENTTVHLSMKEPGATMIGDNNMLMVNTHIAHDCRLGNNILLANNSMLAGHVCVGDRANISGAVAVHQYSRIGFLAMVGGQSHVTQDVPPYMTVDGLTSRIVGLNLIGLRRAGFPIEEIKQLKAAYRIIYRKQLPWREVLKTMNESFEKGPAVELARFLTSSTRGILSERLSIPTHTTLKIHEEDSEDNAEPIINTFPLKVNVG